MSEQRFCDFCGRSEIELFWQGPDDFSELETDQDGLWICPDCGARVVSPPADEMVEDLGEEISALVGESAGAICMTLNLPYQPPYQSITDDASRMQDMYMSAWPFVTQWRNGSTVWRAPDGTATAIVTRDGFVIVERR